MALYYKPFFFVVLSCFISLFYSAFPLSQATENGGLTVDLIHRDSPFSPFYHPSESHFQRLRDSFTRSFARHSTKKLSNKIEAPVAPNGGEYLMKIGVGTPTLEMLAIADTGSDLTWTQCEPCTNCYNQTAPHFNPNKTSTYSRVPCESQQCQALGSGSSSCDNGNGCLYQMSYGDNSYSHGNLAADTFTFDPSNSKDTVAFPNVVFGCGHENQGTFDAKGTGIIGLGGGPLSIVRQLNTSLGGKFSYCLTSLNSNASSKISFGSNAVVAGPNVSSTPLLKKDIDTFYYVTLEGITVGNNRLQNKVIPKEPGEEGNIIIDSGTTLTLLPGNLYSKLEAALVKAVKGQRVRDPQGMFQLCYNVSGNGELSYPPITAHFTGADLAVPQASVFLEVEKGVSCLTFVPSPDSVGVSIFGNLHQIDHIIGYDLVNQKLSFLATDCTKPH